MAGEPEVRVTNPYGTWKGFMLLGILTIFIFTVILYRKQVRIIFQALISQKLEEQIIRQHKLAFQAYGALLTVIFVFITGYLVYYSLTFFEISSSYSELNLYLMCTAGVSIIYFVKYVIINLIVFLLPTVHVIADYNSNVMLVNRALGIMLIPILITATYGNENLVPIMFYVALAISGIALMIRYVRGFLMSAHYFRFYKFYFIVYFCTLEIAPIFIILKISMIIKII